MDNLLEKRDRITYKNKINDTIKLISFNNFKVSILGSASLKSQLYSADYDLTQEIKYKNFETAKKEIIKHFRQIIKRIARNKNVFFIKFKLGFNDELYQEYNTINEIKDFFKKKKKYITKEEYKELMKINDLDELREYTRKLATLRWKPREIMEGYKIVNGKKKTIEDALDDGAVIKLDILAYIDGEFVDLNNLFELYVGNRQLSIKDSKILSNINKDIIHYYEDKNYIKMLKRIFSIAKIKKDKKIIEKITEILNSGVGRGYEVMSNIDNIYELINALNENKLNDLRPKIEGYIQILKDKLGNIYEFDIPLSFFKEFDKISNLKNFNLMLSRLLNLQKKLKELINKEALRMIKNNKINYKKYLK